MRKRANSTAGMARQGKAGQGRAGHGKERQSTNKGRVVEMRCLWCGVVDGWMVDAARGAELNRCPHRRTDSLNLGLIHSCKKSCDQARCQVEFWSFNGVLVLVLLHYYRKYLLT